MTPPLRIPISRVNQIREKRISEYMQYCKDDVKDPGGRRDGINGNIGHHSCPPNFIMYDDHARFGSCNIQNYIVSNAYNPLFGSYSPPNISPQINSYCESSYGTYMSGCSESDKTNPYVETDDECDVDANDNDNDNDNDEEQFELELEEADYIETENNNINDSDDNNESDDKNESDDNNESDDEFSFETYMNVGIQMIMNDYFENDILPMFS